MTNNTIQMPSFITFFKKPIVLGALFLIAVVGGVWVYASSRGEEQEFETAHVERRDIIQEVSVTGTVKPVEAADLAFEQSGRIAWVGADVGEQAVRGQILVALENGETAARLEQARAKKATEEANLEEMLRGARSEEVAIKEAKVEEAETTLEDTRQALLDTFRESYTKADDAIRNQVDQFFTNPRTSNPDIDFVTQYDSNLEFERLQIENTLTAWDAELDAITLEDNMLSYSKTVRSYLEEVRAVLALSSTAINDATDAVKDAYQSDIQTARTNIETELSDLSAAEKSVRAAQTALEVAKRELTLAEAGATEEEIAAQRARVADAEAQIAEYRSQLEKTRIRAPIAGTITKMNAEIGEIAPANEPLVSLISDDPFKIEADIPEVDITKLSVGDTARVTLDAYGSDTVFAAEVAKIDPAETVVEGVPTYTTTFYFAEEDQRIRSGMTADIDITTGTRENALAIPQRAIEFRNGSRFVRLVQPDGSFREVQVTTGLRGTNGLVEITSGLAEGDEVVTFIP